jgi:hypothetical protein
MAQGNPSIKSLNKLPFWNHINRKKSRLRNLLYSVVLSILSSSLSFAQTPTSPSTQTFTPISVGSILDEQSNPNNLPKQGKNNSANGITADDIIRQQNESNAKRMGGVKPQVPPVDTQLLHEYILTQAKQTNQSKSAIQLDILQEIINEDLPSIAEEETVQRLKLTMNYINAFEEIQKMQQDSIPFSLKKAVYLIENAYFDNTMPYSVYMKNIKIKTDVLKTLMRREKISSNNNLGKNYLIQKLYSEKVVEYKEGKVSHIHDPYQYDFEDYLAEKDWSKMFVSKLLANGKGQCHSLPLLYLIFAEETNTKAWLSLAPEHSFIVFSDNSKKTFYNYETTNGNAVSYDWIMESGYINTEAIQNHIYLDTLDQDGLIATLLSDLVMGYTRKFGYDLFIETVIDEIIRIKPNSIQGQMLKADILVLIAKTEIQKNGNPPIEQLRLYPSAFIAYTKLLEQYDLIDNLGYVQMPKEKYEQWLTLLNDAKHIQEKELLNTKITSNAKETN